MFLGGTILLSGGQVHASLYAYAPLVGVHTPPGVHAPPQLGVHAPPPRCACPPQA
jgi:hypothetical protein